MKRKTSRHLFALLLTCVGFGSMAHADQIFVAIKGARTGDFVGEVPNSQKHFAILNYSGEISIPYDTTTAMTRNTRQLLPIHLFKLAGPASLQILQALITNEDLTSVNIDFVRPAEDGSGLAQVYQSIKLSGARISGFVRKVEANPSGNLRTIDDISIVYRQIEFTDPKTGMTVVDQLAVR